MDYIQQNFQEIDEHFAKEQRREIGEEATQMHLARQYVKYGKWANFSKDPEFIKRCNAWRAETLKLMSKGHYDR